MPLLNADEQLMVDLGAERNRKRAAFYRAKDKGHLLGSARTLKSAVLSPYIAAIEQWLEQTTVAGVPRVSAAYATQLKEIADEIGIPTIATLTADSFMASAFSNNYQHTLKYAGIDAMSHVDFQRQAKQFRNRNAAKFEAVLANVRTRRHYSDIRKRQSLKASLKLQTSLDTATKKALGMVLAELFIQSSGNAFVKENDTSPSRGWMGRFYINRTYIRPSTEFKAWQQQYEQERQYSHPVFLPSTQPLLDWVSGDLTSGGLPNIRLPCVKLTNFYGDKLTCLSDLKDADLGKYVFKAMNRCQATAFRLNRRVLSVIKYFHTQDKGILYPTSPQDVPLPPKPIEGRVYSKNELFRWRRITAYAFETRRENRQLRSNYVRNMMLAETVAGMGEGVPLYIPCQLDHRGRMYGISHAFFNYQGGDMAKSLIELHAGCVLTPEAQTVLELQGATLVGKRRQSRTEQLAWVAANRELIYQTADDPLSLVWWTTHKDPLHLLAWIFDYTSAVRDKQPSHFPCVVDASSNVYQILSLLANDHVLAGLTNLSNSSATDADTPQDLYGYLANKIHEQVVEHISTEPLFAYAAQLFTGDAETDRSFIKDVVLAIPYGISVKSIQQKLLNKITEAIKKDYIAHGESGTLFRRLDYKKCTVLSGRLAKLVMFVVHSCFPSFLQTSAIIKSVARHNLGKYSRPVSWTSPSGLPIKLQYPKLHRTTVSPVLAPKTRIRKQPDSRQPYDLKKNYKAAVANYIQSLDAAILHIAFASLPEGIPVFGIHDCVGSSACDLPKVEAAYRNAMTQVFRDKDLLTEFATANDVSAKTVDSMRFPFDADSYKILVDGLVSSKYLLF